MLKKENREINGKQNHNNLLSFLIATIRVIIDKSEKIYECK